MEEIGDLELNAATDTAVVCTNRPYLWKSDGNGVSVDNGGAIWLCHSLSSSMVLARVSGNTRDRTKQD